MPAPVFSTVFSPCGTYLVGGSGCGQLHVWQMPSEAVDTEAVRPTKLAVIDAHRCAIFSLVFVETGTGLLLLSGTDEEVCGWKWSELLSGKKPTPDLRLENPRTTLRRGAVGQLSETSALAVDVGSGRIYSAGGDGNAYAWDLQTGQAVNTFKGAVGDPMYCLALSEQRKQLITGGEDGLVRLWDVRDATCAHALSPLSPPLISGSTHDDSGGATGGAIGGRGGSCGWCGCVAVDDSETWLVAGWGDGFLCSVDLNTLASVACMPTAAAPLACSFEPGSDFHIVSTGAEAGLYHWRLTGELETRATCSSDSALGLAISKRGGVAVGGSAGTIDVFYERSHRAFTLCIP